MNVLSLCSGVGGLELALLLSQPEARPIAFVEKDPFARKVLAQRWPGVPLFDDIFTLNTDDLPSVDVVTAGFPCQPWSTAGEQKGIQDERWIFPEIMQIVRRVGPRYVFLENVQGLLTKGLGHVLGELAEAGFDAEWASFSCAQLGGSHIRNRVFILGHSLCQGKSAPDAQWMEATLPAGGSVEASLWPPGPSEDWAGISPDFWPTESLVRGVAHGVSGRVGPGREHRLRVLGNAVSPIVGAVAYYVLRKRFRDRGL